MTIVSHRQDITDAPSRLPTAAPGQYLGFGLQPVRFCLHLLSAKAGDRVSLEVLDDVAVRRGEGACLVEQVKSGLTQNPVSDWSDDLWKTFANWIHAVQSGHLSADATEFTLCVCPAYSGRWVAKLHEARSAAHAQEVVREIRSELEKLGKVPTGCAKHLQIFLECDDAVRASIITNFTLKAASDDPVDEIRQRLPMVSPALLDEVCRAAIGWAKEQTDKLIRNKQPAEIDAGEFHKWLGAYLRKHDRDHLLTSLAPSPNPDNIDRELRVSTYVRQLALIDCSSDDKIRAVSDYLRARSDRTLWSERGFVLEPSLAEFDDGLRRHWTLERDRARLLHRGRPPAEQGRLLYIEAMGHRANLEGKEVPEHVVPGSMHALAEVRTIGWHPDYESLLSTAEEPADA